MPVKKKTGVKTRKKGQVQEKQPSLADMPDPNDPEKIYPKAEIILTYADGVGDYLGRLLTHHQFNFKVGYRNNQLPILSVQKVFVRVDQKAEVLVRHIKDMHMGAIGDVIMTKEVFDEADLIDPDKSLIDNGIATADKVRILYDYKAYSHPLLNYLSPYDD